LKSVRNRINKGFTGTGLKIPKSENRKPSHGEGVCRGKISYETYDRTYWLRLGVQDWGLVIDGEE